MRNAQNTLFEGGHYLYDFDSANRARFVGPFADAVRFINENQLYRTDLWVKFVKQYTFDSDADGHWRCEYWGKMMRGACFVCNYTRDEKLYAILESTIRDMLTTQDELGRFSTYPVSSEFRDWDMWGRKYIMLGFLYFYEICDDEALCEEIKAAVCRHADYICDRVGAGEGKIPMCKTSRAWLGANAMSILEPFVKLYHLTHDRKYFEMAEEIVREGYESEACIFRKAEEDELDPYQYPENKAYETMSCFDGLAEFYCLTGEERYRKAVLNFGRRVLATDVTVIGSCGCTHELFDHSAEMQVNDDYTYIMQETCVTVTLIKLCGQLFRLSGDMAYIDCIETAFFNAYLGSLNTHFQPYTCKTREAVPREITGVMPFDSYAPLRADRRGLATGGLCIMTDNTYYGCCACIGSAGIGYIPKIAAMSFDEGVLLNFFLPGTISARTPGGQYVRFDVAGNYPYENNTVISVTTDCPEVFTLRLRNPAWSKKTVVTVNGEAIDVSGDAVSITRKWTSGDTVAISFDMKVYPVYPEVVFRKPYVAFRYGCIVLAADVRLGVDPRAVVTPVLNEDGSVIAEPCACPELDDNIICFSLKTAEGDLRLIDYSSAGKDFDKECTAWIPAGSKE